MKLHDLHPAPGSRKASRRVGRGHGSGRGKTAGRGTKGQKSRAGGNLPAWFEGGQTPLHVRTPKLHGFRNRGRVEYAPLNLSRIADIEKGTLVTPDVLEHDGLIRDTKLPVKVLGVGDAPAGTLTVTVRPVGEHPCAGCVARRADAPRFGAQSALRPVSLSRSRSIIPTPGPTVLWNSSECGACG